MKIKTVLILAVALALGELVTMVITMAENVSGSEPAMFSVSAAIWLGGAYLVRRGNTLTGSIVIALFALFHLASYPMWKRTSALDWVWQSTYAAASLACLGAALIVLVERVRRQAVAS
jgi:multisubunit Na+/H+ antiporter MnhE subunit